MIVISSPGIGCGCAVAPIDHGIGNSIITWVDDITEGVGHLAAFINGRGARDNRRRRYVKNINKLCTRIFKSTVIIDDIDRNIKAERAVTVDMGLRAKFITTDGFNCTVPPINNELLNGIITWFKHTSGKAIYSPFVNRTSTMKINGRCYIAHSHSKRFCICLSVHIVRYGNSDIINTVIGKIMSNVKISTEYGNVILNSPVSPINGVGPAITILICRVSKRNTLNESSALIRSCIRDCLNIQNFGRNTDLHVFC